MRSRGLVVAIAVVLAIVASAAVILYTNGVKEDAVTGGSLSEVVVASQDIPANTNLNPLIDQGAFTTLRVPSDAVVDGAVSDPSQLRGLTSTAPILANEQIPVGRLSSGEAPQGGSLGISDGNVAVSIRVDDLQDPDRRDQGGGEGRECGGLHVGGRLRDLLLRRAARQELRRVEGGVDHDGRAARDGAVHRCLVIDTDGHGHVAVTDPEGAALRRPTW